MIARIWLHDIVPMSKQHSRGMCNGRTYTLQSYIIARGVICVAAKIELKKQGWVTPTKEKIALRISYRGNRMDIDNAGGFVQDALQGAAYVRDSQVIMATYRKRLTGPVGISVIIHTLDKRRRGK